MDEPVTLHVGNCLGVLAELPDASVDATVTDPPYELGFMGRAWDASGIAYSAEVWRQCLRVLKPGGHLLAFGGTRTYHRLTCAIEDAGFEVRDSLHWVYGSGFPKSKNHLKPAHEPIVLARKPLAGTVAATVLAHGTGGLNVDACRVATLESTSRPRGTFPHSDDAWGNGRPNEVSESHAAGRWPANVLLTHPPALDAAGVVVGDACAGGCVDGCPVAEMDAQSGFSTSPGTYARSTIVENHVYGASNARPVQHGHGDTGGASRFFPVFRYQAKAPKSERPRLADGTTHPTVKPLALMRWLVTLVTPPGGVVLDPFAGSGTTGEAAALEGMRAVLVEMDETHAELIRLRLAKDAA